VLVGACLGLEMVLSPFAWCVFLGREMVLFPFMWRWALVLGVWAEVSVAWRVRLVGP